MVFTSISLWEETCDEVIANKGLYILEMLSEGHKWPAEDPPLSPRSPEGERVCHVNDMCILLREGTKGLELGNKSCSGDSSVCRWYPYYKSDGGRALGESNHKAILMENGSLHRCGAQTTLCSPPTHKMTPNCMITA